MMRDDRTSHLLEIFKNRRPIPLKFELRPTQRCNLSCIHCVLRTPLSNPIGELPTERKVEILREAISLDAKEIELVGGGEPTLDTKAVMSYIREIKHGGVFGSLTTNGTLFTEDMIREMVELQWDRVQFSIDGANAEAHDYIRNRKGAFDKTVTAMKRFTYWKRKLGLDAPELGINTVITNQVHTQFTGMIELAHRTGAVKIHFNPLHVYHPSAASLMLFGPQLEVMNEHIRKALPLAKKYGIATDLSEMIHKPKNEVVTRAGDVTVLYMENLKETRALLARKLGLTLEEIEHGASRGIYDNFLRFVQIPCFQPWLHLCVNHTGNVYACSGGGFMEIVPSIESLSLKEILDGPVFTDLREMLAKGKLPDFCKGCCIGLFIDNRQFRHELIQKGHLLLEEEARQIIGRRTQ